MPQLPDLEAHRRSRGSTVLPQGAADARLDERRSLSGVPAERPRGTLRRPAPAASDRHGKWRFASAEEDGEAPSRRAACGSRRREAR